MLQGTLRKLDETIALHYEINSHSSRDKMCYTALEIFIRFKGFESDTKTI